MLEMAIVDEQALRPIQRESVHVLNDPFCAVWQTVVDRQELGTVQVRPMGTNGVLVGNWLGRMLLGQCGQPELSPRRKKEGAHAAR